MPGTEGGRGPAFSHHGKWIAFTANARLMKVSAAGGSPVILANAAHLHGAAWSLDDRFVVYAPTMTSGLWRVSADGGPPEQLTRVDPAIGEITHEWPVVAPDGRVYFVINAQVRTLEDSHIASIDPTSGRWSVVVKNALAPRFDGTGHMFYVDRTGALTVAPAPSTDSAPAEPTALAARPFLVSGRDEVYVRPLDRPEPTIRVTTDAAGLEPRWSSDGRRLFFGTATRGLEMVDVTGPPLRVSAVRPVPYVDNKSSSAGNRQTFAVLPDDDILFIEEGDTTVRDRLFVHQDWRALLPSGPGAASR